MAFTLNLLTGGGLNVCVTCFLDLESCKRYKQLATKISKNRISSAADSHWFQCGSGPRSGILGQSGSAIQHWHLSYLKYCYYNSRYISYFSKFLLLILYFHPVGNKSLCCCQHALNKICLIFYLALFTVGATINHSRTVIKYTVQYPHIAVSEARHPLRQGWVTLTILSSSWGGACWRGPAQTETRMNHLPLFPHPGVVPVGGNPHKLRQGWVTYHSFLILGWCLLAGTRTNWDKQCCGSMTFWGGSGSGSAEPCLWLMDSDPDSDPDPGSGSFYFRHWLSRCQQKTKHNFFSLWLFEATFTSFFKDINSKRVTK